MSVHFTVPCLYSPRLPRLRYVTVAKAAFAVSFTLVCALLIHTIAWLTLYNQPCLSLALLQAKPKRSADDYPRLTRRSVLILCAAPFGQCLCPLLHLR